MSETVDPTPAWRLVSTIGVLRAALSPGEPVPPLLRIGAQALRGVLREKLPDREERVLANAEALARATVASPKVAIQVCAYLALVGCGVARNTAATEKSRVQAAVSAIAFSELSTENACAALGVDAALESVASDASLGPELRAIATLAARHTYPKDIVATLERMLEPSSGAKARKPQIG